jgi:hypothetical protein
LGIKAFPGERYFYFAVPVWSGMKYRLFIDDVCRRAVLHQEHCKHYAQRPEASGMERMWSGASFASEEEARRAFDTYVKTRRAPYQFSAHSCVTK